MADLKTDYKDDVLDTSKNTKRKYKMIQNADGTVSFEDVTVYKQEGDSFGGADINATNKFCNSLNQSKLSSIIGSMISASSAVTVDAGKTVDFTVTFLVPDGCESHPFFAYVKSTGWAGLITQGTIVSTTKAEATFTLYNASASQRTVKPQCVALFYKR